MKKMIVSVLALLVLTTSVFANSTYQTLPFSQNWETVSMITANDDWSAVPGILGYLGNENSATPTAVGVQTTLSAYTGSLDVIANQTVANTLTAGGVAEFELTGNAVVALQGSGTADIPGLVIHLNTTGTMTAVRVAYTVLDIDGSADNAVQQLGLQYRIGETGDFTNIPEAYIADASSGPSLTMSTTVSVYLPAACCNQAQVQLRILTSNALGFDEWIGIDDISITGEGNSSAVREWEIYTE